MLYYQEENGLAKRNQRTLIDKIRSMKGSAFNHECLWPELAKTANYLRNRSPTKALNKKNALRGPVW